MSRALLDGHVTALSKLRARIATLEAECARLRSELALAGLPAITEAFD